MSNPDLIKDDEALGNKSAESSFALNQRSFKGQRLNKFTLGHRIVLNQIREESDSVEFFIWSTIFSLIKDRQEIVDLAWNKTKFRSAVIDWVDTMNAKDFEEAVSIVNSIYAELNETSAEVLDKDDDKKK